MSEEVLKPCPFCGSEKVNNFIIGDMTLNNKIICGSCGVSTSRYEFTDEAIEAWNTRIDKEEKEEGRNIKETDNFMSGEKVVLDTGDIGTLRHILGPVGHERWSFDEPYLPSKYPRQIIKVNQAIEVSVENKYQAITLIEFAKLCGFQASRSDWTNKESSYVFVPDHPEEGKMFWEGPDCDEVESKLSFSEDKNKILGWFRFWGDKDTEEMKPKENLLVKISEIYDRIKNLNVRPNYNKTLKAEAMDICEEVLEGEL